MKALIYTGPGTVKVEERPMPGDPGPGELLVHIIVCGICGSDVMDWYMTPRAPFAIGHEPVGEVVAVGDGVTNFKVGDRVALHHHMPCMLCNFCLRGAYTNCPQYKKTRLYPAGLAEYVRVPREIVAGDVFKLPDNMPYEVGSLIEPVACAVRTLTRCLIQHGDTVVVMGAGFTGVLFALLAPHWGAAHVAILERKPVRLERARKMGLNAFDTDAPDLMDQINAWTGGLGPHVVIVTPHEQDAREQGLGMLVAGGLLMIFGPPETGDNWVVDANHIFFKEIDIRSSYSASPHDMRRAFSILSSGILDTSLLITHRFPLDQADEAWYKTKAAEDSLKILVEI